MLRVDNSILKAVATCHTQALLRYHQHRESPEPRAELAAGTAWHKALETWLSTQSDAAFCTNVFSKHYAETGNDPSLTGFRSRLKHDNLRTIARTWFDGHTRETFPLTVTAVEQPFCVRLTDDIEYVGIFDGLGTDKDGRPWILEHKSTGRLTEDWWAGYDLDSQLSGYVWAARELQKIPTDYSQAWCYPLPPVVGAYVNAIEFSQLPSDPMRRCKTHGFVYATCGPQHATWAIRPITRTAEQLEQWKETAITLARQWQALVLSAEFIGSQFRCEQQGMWTGACKWCQFSPFCRMGRPQEFLKANYVVNKWEPLNRGK